MESLRESFVMGGQAAGGLETLRLSLHNCLSTNGRWGGRSGCFLGGGKEGGGDHHRIVQLSMVAGRWYAR